MSVFSKKIGLGVLCALLIALPVFAASQSGPSETLRLGVASALTGDMASHGIPTLNAAKLAAEFINEQGGVLGMQVEIVAQDDQCQPELAAQAAAALVAKHVHGVIGHICSEATQKALPLYTAERLISISPASTTPVLTEDGKFPYFFRTIPNNTAQARLAKQFVLQKLKATRIAILHDSSDYGQGYAQAVEKLLAPAAEAQVVFFDAISPDASDISSIIDRLRKEKADVLLLGTYHPLAAKVVQHLRQEHLAIPIVGPDAIKDTAFIDMAKADAEGVYASSPSDTSKNPLAQRARAKHMQKFGTEPGIFFDNAYSAALALMQAMNKAGTVSDAEKIAQTLRSTYVETPSGRIRFNDKGEAMGIGLSMHQVIGGKFVELDYKILLD